MRILHILGLLSQASVLFPVITGLFCFKVLNKKFKILFWFFVCSVLVEILATWFAKTKHNNLPVLHLYTVIEFFAFSSAYYIYFNQKKYLPNIILINSAVFFIVALTDATFLNGIWKFNNYSRSYASLSLVMYASIYFYYLLKESFQMPTWRQPMYWLSIGVLFYFGLNLFYFLFSNIIAFQDIQLSSGSLYIHSTVNILANCLYAQSFICCYKHKAI